MADFKAIAATVARMDDAGEPMEKIEAYLASVGMTMESYAHTVEQLNKAGGDHYEHNKASGFADGFNQMVTLGAADEILAAIEARVRHPLDDAAYRSKYEELQAQHDLAGQQFREESPWTHASGGLLGMFPALLTGGAQVNAAKTGAQEVSRAGGRVQQALRAGGMGATAGGVSGYVSAHPTERAEGMAEGAGIGGVLGGVLPGATEAVSALRKPIMQVADYVKRVVSPQAAARVVPEVQQAAPTLASAQEKVLQAMERDGTNPQLMRAEVARRAELGVPSSIADVGADNVKGLARGITVAPGAARTTAARSLNAEADQLQPRLAGNLEDLTQRPIANAEQQLDEIVRARGAQAGPAYEAAYARGAVDDPAIAEHLASAPIYREVHENVRAARARVGRPIEPLFDEQGKVVRAPTVEDLDLIQRGVGSEVRSTSGALAVDTAASHKKGVLLDTSDRQRELRDMTRAAVPEFDTASRNFANQSALADAVQDGMQAMNQTPYQIQQALQRLPSEAERDLYRQAAQHAIWQRVRAAADRGERTNLVKELFGFGHGSKRDTLMALFGNDPTRFGRFEQQMRAHLDKVGTRNFVMGGSNTANKLAESADVNEDLTMLNTWRDEPVSWMVRGARAANRVVTERRNAQIAERIFGTNAEEADAFLRALEEFDRARRAAQVRATTSGAVAGVAGGQASRD